MTGHLVLGAKFKCTMEIDILGDDGIGPLVWERLVIWVEGSFAIPGKGVGVSEMWVYITKKSDVQMGGGQCDDIQYLINELFNHAQPTFMMNLQYLPVVKTSRCSESD
jgi:hypothetical protein